MNYELSVDINFVQMNISPDRKNQILKFVLTSKKVKIMAQMLDLALFKSIFNIFRLFWQLYNLYILKMFQIHPVNRENKVTLECVLEWESGGGDEWAWKLSREVCRKLNVGDQHSII